MPSNASPTDQGSGIIKCDNGADGSVLDVELSYEYTAGEWSEDSVPVTMICADVPESPATPSLLLTSLDLLLLEWEPPVYDGGSPILGYSVFMREE